MKSIRTLWINVRLSALLGLFSLAGFDASATQERPNIVLIMADDLGVEGIGSYGGTSYQTPAIDRLAEEGVRFTHAYAQPLCTNTRVQLMTGLYNNRNWLYFGILDPEAKTMGHWLREAGYSTCIAGKWQLQSYDPPNYPGSELRRSTGMKVSDAGFDEYSVFHAWHTEDKGSRFASPTIFENGVLLQQLEGEYGPDHWVAYIKDFIDRRKDDTEPFFVYYPMALPHRPFVPTPKSAEWQNAATRDAEDARHFPDMVEYMDACVGQIVDHIDAADLGENTLVIFYSDNGTHQKITSQTTSGPVAGGKGRTTNAGTHVPLIVRWTGTIGTGLNPSLVDSTDFLPTLMDAGGQSIAQEVGLDGISFCPQLFGDYSRVRPWVFCHYDPRPGWDKDQFRKIRFARDRRFKLYDNGALFDVTNDALEQEPVLESADSEDSREARVRLSEVLEEMPNPDPTPRDGDPEDYEQRLYLAAGDQLAVYAVGRDDGRLDLLQSLELKGAGPFTFAPNRHWMYAASVWEGAGGAGPAIATLEIGASGVLRQVYQAAIESSPSYLMSDNNGEFLAGSHYGPGKASVWGIDPIYRGSVVSELLLEPKAHSAVFSPDNRWLLVPATGPNKVFINHFMAQGGTTAPATPPFVDGPSRDGDAQQPRHLIFHPHLSVAYTTNERQKPGVGVWRWDSERGILEPIQNIVTQPPGFSGRMTTADLHLTPDARFLYVSNRDITDRAAPEGEDRIVAFSVDPQTGALARIGAYPCERIPRSFTVDKLGKFLYVAGQGDSRLGAYRIEDSGALTRLEGYRVGRAPIWVETLSIVE